MNVFTRRSGEFDECVENSGVSQADSARSGVNIMLPVDIHTDFLTRRNFEVIYLVLEYQRSWLRISVGKSHDPTLMFSIRSLIGCFGFKDCG